jgi:hypothetical protein
VAADYVWRDSGHIITVKHVTVEMGGAPFRFANVSCRCGWAKRGVDEADAGRTVWLHRLSERLIGRWRP